MLDDIVDALTCPVCQRRRLPEEPLRRERNSLVCPQHHTFDVARQGYVNLLPGRAPSASADTADMVNARSAFFERGSYEPLRQQLSATVAQQEPNLILDAGAGTGHYLAAALDEGTATGIAIDTSKYALRSAARCHRRAGAILADVWRDLPVRSGTVDVILSVFAPRNGVEFARLLRPDGIVVVASPTTRHLAELVDSIGALSVDERKAERLAATFGDSFTLDDTDLCEFPLLLSHDEAEMVLAMGPSAHHLERSEIRQRVTRLNAPIAVTASVQISTWRLVSNRTRRHPTER